MKTEIETEQIISREEHKKFLTAENAGTVAIATTGLIASVSMPAMADDPLAALTTATTTISGLVTTLGATVLSVVVYKVGSKMFKSTTSQT